VRGLPFLPDLVGYLLAFAVLTGDYRQVFEVSGYVTQHCHDYDFEACSRSSPAHMEEQPERLLGVYEQRLAETPEGYFGMMVAIIKARSAPDLARTEELLRAAKLSENDLWLESVPASRWPKPLTASSFQRSSRACQGDRRADSPPAARRRTRPRLHLLRYQERLKAGAQQRPKGLLLLRRGRSFRQRSIHSAVSFSCTPFLHQALGEGAEVDLVDGWSWLKRRKRRSSRGLRIDVRLQALRADLSSCTASGLLIDRWRRAFPSGILQHAVSRQRHRGHHAVGADGDDAVGARQGDLLFASRGLRVGEHRCTMLRTKVRSCGRRAGSPEPRRKHQTTTSEAASMSSTR